MNTEQLKQDQIAGIGAFRCRLALEEAAAICGRTPAALLLYSSRILDFLDIPIRAVEETSAGAVIGRVSEEQVGILLPGADAHKATQFASEIQRRLPEGVNGSGQADLYVYQARGNGLAVHGKNGSHGKNAPSAPNPVNAVNAVNTVNTVNKVPQTAGDNGPAPAPTNMFWQAYSAPTGTPTPAAPDTYPMDPFAVLGPDPHSGLPPWKRALDLVGAAAALIVLSPLLALLALGIKLASPGPILFRQERVGFRGRRFTLLKFRSMHVNCDTEEHQAYLKSLIQSDTRMQKLDNDRDPRLIPLGKLLRASALDELPQLFNVLRGEMSLVGPRPAIPYEYDEYEPWQKLRCNAAPGMTGLWQVSGKNNTTFTEMVNLDIRYSRVKSLGLDLKILILTPRVIIAQLHDIVTRNTGANAHEGQTEPRSGWVRVLGPKSNS